MLKIILLLVFQFNFAVAGELVRISKDNSNESISLYKYSLTEIFIIKEVNNVKFIINKLEKSSPRGGPSLVVKTSNRKYDFYIYGSYLPQGLSCFGKFSKIFKYKEALYGTLNDRRNIQVLEFTRGRFKLCMKTIDVTSIGFLFGYKQDIDDLSSDSFKVVYADMLKERFVTVDDLTYEKIVRDLENI